MRSLATIALIATALAAPALAADKQPRTRFWNLTGETIKKFELAPAGTQTFGPDQCKNDKDGTSEHDERLRIEGIEAGVYDARMTFVDNRVCMTRGLKVEVGGVFSVEADQLKDCTPAK